MPKLVFIIARLAFGCFPPASAAIACIAGSVAVAQTSVDDTKEALSTATKALASSEAKPDQITAELTAIKAQIAAMEARSAPLALKENAASARTLVELLRYARTDPNVIKAIDDLRNALAIYDAPDPVGALSAVRNAIETLDPGKTVPPTATGVNDDIEMILAKALELEEQLPNSAAVARATHLTSLIKAQTSSLLQSSVSTAFGDLADALSPFIYRTHAEASGAQVVALQSLLTVLSHDDKEDLIAAKEDELRNLAITLDNVLGFADPRLVIVSARFGDFRPGVSSSRTCNATAQVRSKCVGKNTCDLESVFPDVTSLCGFNPAPTAPEGATTLRVAYGCEAATRAEWQTLMANPGKLSDNRAPIQGIYPGPLGTIACEPNRPDLVE